MLNVPIITPASFPQEPPYLLMKNPDSGENLTGNDQYEGFCVDMLNEIAKEVGFKYVIQIVNDGNYGAQEPDGTWNGMVGELIEKVRFYIIFMSYL